LSDWASADVDWLRDALRGAGTLVWEWDMRSDRLAGIELGLLALGHSGVGAARAEFDALLHPADRPASRAAFRRHARGGSESCDQAYRVRASGGEWRWVRSSGRIVERHADGRPRRMLGTLTDITDERHHAGTAALAAQRLEGVSMHVPGVLYQFEMGADHVPRFAYLSAKADALLGIDAVAAQADASDFLARIASEQRDAFLASVIESAHTLAPWRREFAIRMPDGAERWILGNSSPMRMADGGTVWHGYLQDVTEQRDLERARRETLATEAANRASMQFLSHMSHELRTPLNAVLGFSQLLEMDRNDALSDGQRRRVRLIRESGEQLLGMIAELLDLTRTESGGLHIAGVPLRALAEEVFERVGAAAAAAQVRLQLHEEPPQLAAHADRARLRQVLLNLLANAIKYSPAGGEVRLAIAATAGGEAPSVSLCVHDSGEGIHATELQQLSEPYERLVQAGGAEGGGIGLGLTRALVTLMRGRIEVSSARGAGSHYCVILPRA
jgi:signal transduction histidine kinase